jgi:hypothetical protein
VVAGQGFGADQVGYRPESARSCCTDRGVQIAGNPVQGIG